MHYAMAGGGGPEHARAGAERDGQRYLGNISVSQSPQTITTDEITAVRQALDGWGVTTVVIPDPAHLPLYERLHLVRTTTLLITAATGRRPVHRADAWVWTGVDRVGPPLAVSRPRSPVRCRTPGRHHGLHRAGRLPVSWTARRDREHHRRPSGHRGAGRGTPCGRWARLAPGMAPLGQPDRPVGRTADQRAVRRPWIVVVPCDRIAPRQGDRSLPPGPEAATGSDIAGPRTAGPEPDRGSLRRFSALDGIRALAVLGGALLPPRLTRGPGAACSVWTGSSSSRGSSSPPSSAGSWPAPAPSGWGGGSWAQRARAPRVPTLLVLVFGVGGVRLRVP